jgi:hypothetical protein
MQVRMNSLEAKDTATDGMIGVRGESWRQLGRRCRLDTLRHHGAVRGRARYDIAGAASGKRH